MADLQDLERLLGDRLVRDASVLAELSHDSSRVGPEGAPRAAVRATSTADVSAALAWAHEHDVPVSVRGAGTGLAGGANAYPGGLVVSLADMTEIVEIDAANRTATVQAGVITAQLDARAREAGLFFPPDPASARTSTIGGNIATNAGGLRCVAHGVTNDSVAALVVVLADGRVMRTGARTRKNVVGYDLTSLFVGSEGTLGVVTEATVRLKPIPPGTPRTFRASFDTLEAAGSAVTAIVNGDAQPEVLELMDALSVEIIESFQPSGLTVPAGAMLVGQTVGLDAAAKAESITATCRAQGATETEISDTDALLEARRLSNPALNARGLKIGCDVGVPVAALAEVFHGIAEISERHGKRVSTVAHAGDGNLHSTVEAPDDAAGIAAADAVIDDITKLAISLGGTISGEHGIGSVKQHELPWQLDEAALDVQRAIKLALDPRGILTPGRGI
ncbi:FAD-binding oxidoreductase [Leucobacter chromiireducens]|uniref:FAD-binding protein n=1 Tax=Leucobacter chromiireducens subsp. chromiireducens TaxID=660067 RepID=A0ABS1SR97_9MICO|nr:FAD-binding oxidoreductase [Leucobacter chromiireducens]MBL3690687.1 FAD-binding protein [Leucobacter chromiireducens subsp. chromiireducens]